MELSRLPVRERSAGCTRKRKRKWKPHADISLRPRRSAISCELGDVESLQGTDSEHAVGEAAAIAIASLASGTVVAVAADAVVAADFAADGTAGYLHRVIARSIDPMVRCWAKEKAGQFDHTLVVVQAASCSYRSRQD